MACRVSGRTEMVVVCLLFSGCKEPSSTHLTSSTNPTFFGDPVVFTAQVTIRAFKLPPNVHLGSVAFLEGSTVLCTSPVDETRLAKCTTEALTVGGHQVKASYSGNAAVSGSVSGVVRQDVRKANPKLSLTASSNPAIISTPVTLTAAILGPPDSATGGTVTFQDGPNFLGTGSPDTSGKTTISATSLNLGTHEMRATYSGNANFNGGAFAILAEQILPPNSIVPTDNSGGVTPAPAGGNFAVSADGAATFDYPIWAPQGRRGIEPNLALTYNSRRENGLLGVGWSLQGLSTITRCKRDMARDGFNAAIQFSDADAFCLDGQRLVTYPSIDSQPQPSCGTGAVIEYRTEEESFVRILSGPTDSGGKGPQWFEADFKDGRVFCYGTTADSRLEGQRFHNTPAALTGTTVSTDLSETVRLTWALAEMHDRFGNNLAVQYCPNANDPNCPPAGDPGNSVGFELLPQTIRYTGSVDQTLLPQRSVTFKYEDRCDTKKSICDTPTEFVSGLMLQLRHRLSQIVLSAPNPIASSAVKTYNLKYSQSESPRATLSGRSLLTGVTECDAAGICTLPTAFGYSQATVPDGFLDVDTGIHDDSATGESTTSVGARLGPIIVGDFNGDGCDDFIYTVYTTPNENGIQSLQHVVYRLSACYDAINEGAPAFPWKNPGEWFYQLSPPVSPGGPNDKLPIDMFPPRSSICVTEFDFYNCNFDSLFALDLDLDGRADLVRYQGISGLQYSNNTQDITTSILVSMASSLPPAGWTPYKPLFGNLSTWQTKDTVQWCTGAFPNQACPAYESVVAADINGDGFPDLITLMPLVWFYRLNHGRTLSSSNGSNCGSYGEACVNLDARSQLFSGDAPTVHSCNGGSNIGGFTWIPAVDIDRDGTTEILLRDPKGPNWYAAFSLDSLNNMRPIQNLALLGGEASCPARRDWFADINGDGLPDVVSVQYGGGNPFVSLNTGNGFQSPVQVPVDIPLTANTMLIFDYDGNGSQDLIYPTASGLRALLGLGNRLPGPGPVSTIPLNAIDSSFNLTAIPRGQSLQTLDANGDGLADLIQVVNGDIHVYIRQGQKRDLLAGVNDRGAQISIRYSPLSSAATYQTTVPPGVVSSTPGPILPPMSFPATQTYVMNRGPWVVTSYSIPRAGNLGSPDLVNTFTFSYQDARTSLLGRGWLGFAKVIQTDQQTGVVTTTTYDNSTPWGSAYPYARRPIGQTVTAQLTDSGLFHQTTVNTAYQTQGSTNPFSGTPDGRYFAVFPTNGSEKEYEGPSQLTVSYALKPQGDPGTFNVQIDSVTYGVDTLMGGSTGPVIVGSGTHTISLAADPGTDPNSYGFQIAGDCTQAGNQGTVSTSPGDTKNCAVTIFRQEPVVCSVFDDDFTNIEGPSDAIFISGRSTNNEKGKACIPGGQFGDCHKSFGKCRAVNDGQPVFFNVFGDGYTNVAGPSDAIFINSNDQACIPDGTTNSTCRKWFGRALSNDGRTVSCSVFDDGYANITAVSDAIFIPDPNPSGGKACVPNNTSQGDCRRWFGRCATQSLTPP